MATNNLHGDHMKEDGVISDELNTAEIICVIGGQGVGKGTQCTKLARDFSAVHVSVGDLFREQAEKLKAEKKADVKSLMSNGLMAPIGLTQKLVEECLRQNVRAGATRIFVDGFPRSAEQASLFKDSGCEVRAVLYFKASKEIMLSRMMNRAPTSGRVDDNAEAFEKRYKGFVKEIEEIAGYYERQNKLCEVDCEGPLDKIYEQLVEQVKEILGEDPRSTASLAE